MAQASASIGVEAPSATALPGDLRFSEYQPRSPSDTVLHQVVVEHLETFLEEARARSDGYGVPIFVERAFRSFVECGSLAGGFARIRCPDCGFERLLPFSCKRRGICPSCAGRRMTELSAHLVDSVIPTVPVRQWVLTLPYPLRYSLAWNHERSRAVLAIFFSRVQDFYRRRAEHLCSMSTRKRKLRAPPGMTFHHCVEHRNQLPHTRRDRDLLRFPPL